ncbi:MAG: hypothetical protein H8F28_26100, partial [Fibrella sp.]|nr:hypothetical protein [Armatimonadota bacterium]
MQLFRSEENLTSNAAPRYDSEMVRQVLARASEIESQAETELLTADQVEALGSDLGLSSEAVRRALGERTDAGSDLGATSMTGRRRALVPLTQEQVKAAYLPNLWFALICFPIIFGLAKFMYSNAMPSGVGIVFGIGIGFVIPLYLAFRSGFLAKRVGVATVGGLLTVLIASCISLIALLSATPNSNGHGIEQAILLML